MSPARYGLILIAALASVPVAADATGAEPPTLDDFMRIGPLVCMTREVTDRERPLSPWASSFAEAAGARPIAELLHEPGCQGVLRVVYDSCLQEFVAVATLRFTSDGLHVYAAHFGALQMGNAARRDLRAELIENGVRKELVIHEERDFPVKTRNDLAEVLDWYIGVSTLESVTLGVPWDRRRIGTVPGPRTNHMWRGYDMRHKWFVELGVAGDKPSVRSFVFGLPDSLPDVRYAKLLLCVGEVCEVVRSLYAPRPHVPRVTPRAPEEAGEVALERMSGGEPEAVSRRGGPDASQGSRLLPVLIALAAGLALGSVATLVVLRGRRT